MNPRERYLAALLYGKPDRVPLEPGHGRKSTRETWYKQGLPQDVKNTPEYAYRQAGGKLDWPQPGEGLRKYVPFPAVPGHVVFILLSSSVPRP